MTKEPHESRWMAVVGSPSGERARVADALEAWGTPRLLDTVDEVLRLAESRQREEAAEEAGYSGPEAHVPDGLVLLAPDVTAEDTFRAMEGAAEGAFVVAQVLEGGEDNPDADSDDGSGPFRLRPLSVGFDEGLGGFMERWAPGDSTPGSLLELRHAVGLVRRVRHDINNPLTAALAEVQLLLMDVTEEEPRESLEVVQEQLRRIRERVQELSGLRPPWG